jgi:enterochelin esterase-like enzyme
VPPENRNVEYDAFSDAYATFLLTEILREVRDRYAIADDPDRWAIGGGGSGGSCAFTVGWMRPDRFRRVLCFLGSFPQIPGANRYPELIRGTPRKPLRVFLQAATHDLNWGPEHNWLSPDLQLAAALAERDYELRAPQGSDPWGWLGGARPLSQKCDDRSTGGT